ncbi:sulfatase family protein [Carboxylicivirga sp. RSCT41]|uniref:sulfatase family protein n=1 Tax=Carboxylicivirga agarovorans TaxID=3417570 RepID=UPI003D33BA84
MMNVNNYVRNIAVLLGLILVCWQVKASEPEKRPNILIIQPDQHRGSVLGIDGDVDAITPHLDAMAKDGIRFTNAISGAPVCSPFRASLISGMHIHKHGVVGNNILLNPELRTLGNIFEDAGYATGYIGKWHLDGGIPEEKVGGYIEAGERRQGWQEFMGYEKSHEFIDVWRYDDNKQKVRVEGYDWEPTWHTDMALDFIKRKTAEGKPWCYYLAYGPPHLPEQCPTNFLGMYDPSSFHLPPDIVQNLSDSQQKELREDLQMYYAQVTAIDFEVGRIMKHLKAMGVDENTIVLYTSDHGDVLGSHNQDIADNYKALGIKRKSTLRTKGKPYLSAMDVPLLIRWPKHIATGQVCDALVNTIDITATILDLVNLEKASGMQGTSMADWCLKGEGTKKDALYIGLSKGAKAWRGVYDGRYIYSTLGWPVLYDHATDPCEMNNLYDSEEHATIKEQLHQLTIEKAVLFEDPAVRALKKQK